MSLCEEIDGQDKLILDSFISFILETNILNKSEIENTFDSIISSYIINTIKQFYEEYENHRIWLDDSKAQEIDVDSFIEIIDAYLPSFSNIESKKIIKWLVDLKKNIDFSISETKSKEESNIRQQPIPNVDSKYNLENEQVKQEDPNINLLIEMFPDIELKEINKIYTKSNKDNEKTIEHLLIIQNSKFVRDDVIKNDEKLTDEEKKILKEKTVKKFGLIAVNEDGSPIEVKPKFNWNSEKKMVRYFENKVVTTKGEKYFELKTEEDEEMEKNMKKTYVNLKPARKYRFH